MANPISCWIALLFISALGGATLWQVADSHPRSKQLHGGGRDYVQRVSVDDLADAATHTHFDQLAGLLSALAWDAEGIELPAEETLGLLDAIARPLVAESVPAASVERTRLLLEKSLPDQRGLELGALLEGYICYLRQRDSGHQHSEPDAGGSVAMSLRGQRQRHALEVAVREACLGRDKSRVLFAERDRLTQHLLQRGDVVLQQSQRKNAASEAGNRGRSQRSEYGQ